MTSSIGTDSQVCKASGNIFHVEKPCDGSNVSMALSTEAPTYFNFGLEDIVGWELVDDGALLISFTDGSTLMLENYTTAMNSSPYKTIELNDGETIDLTQLAQGLSSPDDASLMVADSSDVMADDLATIEPAAGETETVTDVVVEEVAQTDDVVVEETVAVEDVPADVPADVAPTIAEEVIETVEETIEEKIAKAEEEIAQSVLRVQKQEIAQMNPEDLAAIEPAAGDAPAGALGNTGANFGSAVSDIGLGAVNAVGPIGVTSLSFDLPTLQDDPVTFAPLAASVNPPSLVVDDNQGYEDGTVEFPVTASPSQSTDYITVIISDIQSGWTPDLTDTTTANGTFDSVNGTWTITLGTNETLSSGPIFTPPLNSDEDITPLTVTVNQYGPSNTIVTSTSDTMTIVTDAVADDINLTANDVSGYEDNPVALDIDTSLIDTDGSEEITQILISGVPTGFALSAGTEVSTGVWEVAQSDLANLEMTAPADYSGTVTLDITVTNEEVNLSDTEFDFTNNDNVTTTSFDVTFAPMPDAATLTVDNPIVKEDGTVDLNISATLEDPSEYLVVTVSNIDATWGVSAGSNNGTYDAATGTWTITMPAGTDYTGTLTFTPPADSDVDMTDILVTAQSVESDGTSTTVSTYVDIVVDAVADTPTLDVDDITGQSGQSYALDITNAVTDTDGSESLGVVTISGVPTGFSLSAGTEVSTGVWEVTQSDLSGLMLNTVAGYDGDFDLTVSVTTTDTPTDTEVDYTDNTATVTDTINVSLSIANANPPSVDIDGTHQVLEDGSVYVPFSASLSANALSSEVLTVTLTGIDASWTIDNIDGTYDAATGTWTITMPAGTDYTGGLTFTPPADSDVDMTGLTLTATATQPTNNSTQSADADTTIVVDAVADTPTIDADDITASAGSSVALNITNATTDVDGSESLGVVTISGLPTGYSLSAGTEVSTGVWEVSQAQLSGLLLNVPATGTGSFDLDISVTATESVTDTDFNLNNNEASNTDTITITVDNNATPPSVDIDGTHQVLEDGSVFVPFSANLNGADSSEVLTVTLTGIDASWTVTTGTNNGTYDAATGTWTITMPAGTDYTGGLTFYPPANSDVDMSGLTLTATSSQPGSSSTETASANTQIIVDAVADMPTLVANNANGIEGQSIGLSISAGLTDTDGSETLSVITISGVPTGFSLSAGTEVSTGVWELTQAQLSGLKLNTPSNYSGTVSLDVSVTSTEQVTDTDFDLTNNTATNTDTINVVIADTANPPSLDVDGTHKVLEDGSVYVPFSASITGDNSEVLTVTVSGIDPSWTITNTDGTYDAATGTWTITMPAGVDYTGGLTFTPPADSDVDLTGITVKATSFAPNTNTTSSVAEIIQIVVDAVADTPDLDAGADTSVVAGQSVALDIDASLTDTDGSETLSMITISGVPSGYSLSAGTEVSTGVWEVSQSDLSGLMLNTPGTGSGDVTLNVSVTSTESVTDDEFNLNNNTATNTDTVVISVTPDQEPPTVTFGANGSGSAQVLEDGSVAVPVTATLNGDADQQLTVTITGISSDWTLTDLAGGTYDASTGTWTITMPAGQDFSDTITFKPAANSDVDLTGLTVTATSEVIATGTTSSSSTDGQIIVDAVADMPTLTATNASGEEGTTFDLDISAALTDTDGSEVLSVVTISGVPTGVSLNYGTEVSTGVWEVPANQLSNLQVTAQDGTTGTYNLTVSVTSTETVTDEDYNLNNNTATNTTTIQLVIGEDDVPVITQPSAITSKEANLATTNVITGSITVDFGDDAAGAQVCVPTNGVFTSTGAMAGGALTSGGVAVDVTVNGSTYTGTANGVTVFTLTVNTDGSYVFEQFEPLDHASATDPDEIINLNFGICAMDGDGDISSTTLTVKIQDTGPIARNDVVTLWSCDWAANGNVITNYNQDTAGTDKLSAEGDTTVQSISYDGNTYSFVEGGGEIIAISGDYGYLYINIDGSYTYVSYMASPDSSQNEEFTYTIVDGDGDVSTATLSLEVVKVTQSQNEASDYGIWDGYNAIVNGETVYQTQDTDGAMVFGKDYYSSERIAGNSGNDTIFAWKGNDTLYGMDGNDFLFGEQGNNTLYGGEGSDVFVIHADKAGNEDKYDTIMDFNLDEGDVLSLVDVITGFDASSDITDYVRIEVVNGEALVQVDEYGNSGTYNTVAKIEDHGDIDINSLDVQELFDQGHIDVY